VELRNCSSRTVPNASTWCGGSSGCRPGSAEITSPGRRRIERAVVLVVLNFLRLGQQIAVALRVLRRPLYVAGESADGIHRWPPAQREDLGAIVVQIANRNQRAEIAWRRTVVGEAGVADVGDVFVGQLAAKLALP
jgi:hypothetical protein